jgi:hypothetical protein
MKNVLWAPFRRWTSSVYSHWQTATNHASRSDQTGPCSQDPIINGSAQNDYQLDQMAFEKTGQYSRAQDPGMLEKAIAQIPVHHHPHSRNIRLNDSVNGSVDLKRQASPEPLLINKETSFHVSTSAASSPYNKEVKKLPVSPPPGQVPHRPRHQPIVAPRKFDDVTPRGLDGLSTRHNASPGLAPTSDEHHPDEKHINEARSPPTPWSLLSGEKSPQVTSPQKKREGRSFFFD